MSEMSELPELLQQGPLKPVADIAEERLGTRPSHQSTWRWWKHGVGGVRLLTVTALRQRLTTLAAFDDFLNRRAEAALSPKETVPAASDDDLRQAGLL